MSITRENKVEIVGSYGVNSSDTGNVTVQCAIWTYRINNLTKHCISNPHDHHTRRGLLKLVGRRKRMLNYFKNKDASGHKSLIAKLGIRK